MCFKGIRVRVLNSISCWSKALLDLDLHKNDCLLQFMTRFLRKVLFFLHGKLNSSPNKTKFTCLSFWSMFCPINALIFFLKLQEKAYELLNRTRLVSFVSVLKLFLEIYWIFKFLSIKTLHIPTIMNKKRIKLWVWFFFKNRSLCFKKSFDQHRILIYYIKNIESFKL